MIPASPAELHPPFLLSLHLRTERKPPAEHQNTQRDSCQRTQSANSPVVHVKIQHPSQRHTWFSALLCHDSLLRHYSSEFVRDIFPTRVKNDKSDNASSATSCPHHQLLTDCTSDTISPDEIETKSRADRDHRTEPMLLVRAGNEVRHARNLRQNLNT